MVWARKRKLARSLPWRETHDPYRILVSELMLQQTQVERVIPKYLSFLKKFPTVKVLAKAPLSDVLKEWQGLGYNRRAKYLHLAAKEIVKKYGGRFPKSIEELEELPGIGPYTARAVAAFSWNEDSIFIETNIRTVILHHFFPKRRKVADKDIEKILTAVYPKGKAREWHSTLMDYGSYLKRSGVKLNPKSRHYVKQSKFEGSARQARGAILKKLQERGVSEKTLLFVLGKERKLQVKEQIGKLLAEGLIEKRGRHFCLPR